MSSTSTSTKDRPMTVKDEEDHGEEQRPTVTVVLLGWLGSESKNLTRFAQMYNSYGFRAVTIPAPLREVLLIDLGTRLQKKLCLLASELASWLSDESESEKDGGHERVLIFHTFSSTGWILYGAILENLHEQGRVDVLSKVKGCVIDSGGDPRLDPKVYAAGFTAALVKKRWYGEGNESENGISIITKIQEKGLLLIECLLLSFLEKLFSFILDLPSTKQWLTNTISVLSKKQPDCPQLYLYSTADRVVPFEAIESFIEEQRETGRRRRVWSFNFGSSAHLNHYRTFTSLYASQLEKFLKECHLVEEGKPLHARF